ncbi:MAG TPA: EAL domain-containing protein [Pseudolabrys sp.]
MSPSVAPSEEHERLAALREYGIDAALAEPGFDRLVQLAANVFGVSTALVSLVEAERQLFAARVGLEVCETSRDVSFCAHAIEHDEIMVVPDARLDPRFRGNPLVTGEPHIRFYAGVPLRSPSGYKIGTLCIIDGKPRATFTESDRRNLADLGALVLDKLEMRRLELARRSSQNRFENIAATSPDAIICADEIGRVTFWNAAATKLLGYSSADILGRGIDLISTENVLGKLRRLSDTDESLLEGRTVEFEVRRKDGSAVPVELSVSMWREEGHASFGAILRDITERRINEERLFRLAHRDPLTGMPNRAALRERIEKALEGDDAACVMMVDLDGFKDINDSFGHSGGDSVLIETAQRLQACVRATDTVARMGGDEFAILLPGVGDPIRAAEVADAVIKDVSEILSVDGQPVNIGASVGIAIFPAHGATAEELLSCADLALYQAKEEGRHCRRFFAPGLRHAATLKRAYQGELRRAYDRGEFELFYQPQVRLSDGALVGAEALLRWRHPDKGIISPAAFLPALESSPLAAQVGDWVVMTACRQAMEWRREGKAELRMGVNLFGAQFRHGDLARKVHAALAETGLPPKGLELEITENIILRHDEAMIAPLRALHAEGVGIAFDDYGTGYASLSMLKRYPLTRLKVDESFTRGMCDSPTDAAIVRAILYLGRSFGLEVIAEGVETEEQAARLRKKGCEEAQGFLFGRPAAASDFARRFDLVASGDPMLRRSAG